MDIKEILTNLSIAGYIFFGLFLVAGITQIVLAALNKEKIRRIEKTFCLFFLFLFAVVSVPTFPFLYIGVFFGMLGELLLDFRKKMLFYNGSFSFAAGHIFYLVSIILLNNPMLKWWVFLLAGIIAVSFYLVTTNIIAKRLTNIKFEQYTMMGYFTILLFNFVIMIFSTANMPLYLFVTSIGGFIFILSDAVIVYNQFYKPIKNAEVIVMSTYLLAQVSIVVGLLLTILAK